MQGKEASHVAFSDDILDRNVDLTLVGPMEVLRIEKEPTVEQQQQQQQE
jgi:hypothetical protein